MELYLASSKGLVIAENDAHQWSVVQRSLDGHHVTAVIAREGVILAGTTDGVFRSEDHGRTWQETNNGLTIGHVRWMAYHPDISDFEFAGTEPAAIFISRDGGNTWRECPEVSELRDRFGWWLPYSPRAGCVRGFAFHGSRAYAAVEVGAALRSDNGGETWQLASGSDGIPKFGPPPAGFIHPDVHSIVTHPSSPDLVFAPTGGGFYQSRDGGKSWNNIYEDCYVRAVWADPEDPTHLILGPAEDPSGTDGRIEETLDGGQRWQPITERWSGNMVERFTQIGERLFAVMSNGQLLSAHQEELRWQPLLSEISGVNAITAMY